MRLNYHLPAVTLASLGIAEPLSVIAAQMVLEELNELIDEINQASQSPGREE